MAITMHRQQHWKVNITRTLQTYRKNYTQVSNIWVSSQTENIIGDCAFLFSELKTYDYDIIKPSQIVKHENIFHEHDDSCRHHGIFSCNWETNNIGWVYDKLDDAYWDLDEIVDHGYGLKNSGNSCFENAVLQVSIMQYSLLKKYTFRVFTRCLRSRKIYWQTRQTKMVQI